MGVRARQAILPKWHSLIGTLIQRPLEMQAVGADGRGYRVGGAFGEGRSGRIREDYDPKELKTMTLGPWMERRRRGSTSVLAG
jgi:hypothetical protein